MKLESQTEVLNFFGGPGIGKSTTATGVFHALKKLGISCEYVSEYAKDIVWEETTNLLSNQIHVFAEQLRRQVRLVNKVDYIITDSPLLLSCVYGEIHKNESLFSSEYVEETLDFYERTFKEFNNINFFLTRTKEYDPKGRLQTLEGAKQLDDTILKYLIDKRFLVYNINYDNAVDEVLNLLGLYYR